jgi:hypothetical protein
MGKRSRPGSVGSPSHLSVVPAAAGPAPLRVQLETLSNLIVIARTAAASLLESERDSEQLRGEIITTALDDALSDLRLIVMTLPT